MSKYFIWYTKGLLIDNDKSNISNELSTRWLVCYLEQDLKPHRIQLSSWVLSWFVELAFCVPVSLKYLCIGSFVRNFISIRRNCFILWFDCSFAWVLSTFFSWLILIIPYPLTTGTLILNLVFWQYLEFCWKCSLTLLRTALQCS